MFLAYGWLLQRQAELTLLLCPGVGVGALPSLEPVLKHNLDILYKGQHIWNSHGWLRAYAQPSRQ